MMETPVIRAGQQNIKYSGSESAYSATISRENVIVHCNVGKHSHGSSKMKLINRIDYNWEFQYYQGQLIAMHINGKIIAYGMKGKDGGMVRVTNQETGKRTLIKNRKRDVKDVAFSFSRQQVILGYVDDEGSVWIYEIKDDPEAITFDLLLHIYHRNLITGSIPNYRIIWCPFIEEEDVDSSDEPEKMFVVLNGSKAEVWNFGLINAKYGNGPIEPNEDYRGYIEINHSADLVDASFSSDGTAIAIASNDGYVKFFQVYMIENEKQKCLHEWIPHEGKPLSSIIFVDNLLECSSQCWKFTITGANYNSELKLWSCETWSCLQTIIFKPNPDSLIQNVYLKIAIDYTGQFLVLSDINNKALYVLNLKRNEEAQLISVTMLSQFLLPASFLSFHITLAEIRKLRTNEINNSDDYCNDLNNHDDSDDLDDDLNDLDEDDNNYGIVLNMLVIQQKKFQECKIVYQPEPLLTIEENDQNSLDKIPKLDELQSSVTLLIQQTQQSQLNSRPNSVKVDVKSVNEKLDSDNLIDFQKPEKDHFASGGSSPSREVQEILSLNNTTQDYFDTLIKDEQPQKEFSDNYKNTGDKSNSDNNWPKIPLVKENDLIRENGDNDAVPSINSKYLQTINYRLSSLENVIRDQNKMLQKWHQQANKFDNTNEFLKEIDLTMSKQQLQIAKMLENFISMQKNLEREQHEFIINNISQIVVKHITEKIQIIVNNEMKNVLLPSIRNLMDTFKQNFDMQTAQKFNETVLQEKLVKIVNSRALAESLANSVVNIVSPILEKSYKDMISTSLIPTWEKVCSNMFHQINDTFNQGTKEYTASVEGYMDKQRRVQEKSKELVTQMQSVTDNLQSSTDKFTNVLSLEINKQFNSTFKLMQDVLSHSLKEVVIEQVKLGFKSQASVIEDSVINAVRSRAVTPSPHYDSQTTLVHIDQHLARENYDEAFQIALSAENLNCVIYVCEKVDVNVLFHERTPAHSCILALIQQLSVELTKNTELKLNYIRAALLALNPEHPQARQFIPKVLRDLLKQLKAFISTNPTSRYSYDAKLLKMAAESMLDK